MWNFTKFPTVPQFSHDTHHCILGVGLLIVHLSDLLLRGALDLTQHAEPLAVTMETTPSASSHHFIVTTQKVHLTTSFTTNEQLCWCVLGVFSL